MGAQLPAFTKFDNPAAAAQSPTKQFTLSYLVSVNARLLLSPCDLCCDWTMNTVPLVEAISDLRNLATLVTVGVAASLLRSAYASKSKKHSEVLMMSLAMIVFPFLPASNLFFPVGFVVAERCLYLPSMGFCLLVAYGWRRLHLATTTTCQTLPNKRTVCSFFALFALLLIFGAKTYTRNWDWRDEHSLFTSGLRVTKNNAKLFNNVGHALESKGDYAGALAYFKHAAQRVQPDDVGAHINVGRTYNNLKMFKQAEEAYLKAKSLLPRSRPGETYQARVAPNHLNVFLNLATLISKNSSRLEEADSLYRQAISMRSDYTQAYINRGDVLIKMNRTKEAQKVYEKALAFEQDNPDLLYNLGVVLLNQGNRKEALSYLDKALQHDPNHYQALLNSAILIQESGDSHLHEVATDRLQRIIRNQDEVNERVYFNLGMLAMDKKDVAAAEGWFRKAIEVKPDFRSALFNLALLLSESGRPLEGAPVLRQLLRYFPDHVKGLILMGDLYVNQLRDLPAAESCYARILKVDPGNVQAMHNRCVVMVEAGHLEEARKCLWNVHRSAPGEQYIINHVKIVEERIDQLVRSSKEPPAAPNSSLSASKETNPQTQM